MATARNKKKAREVRERTRIRKIVYRIRRLEEKVSDDLVKDTPEYWYAVVSGLKIGELQLAVDYCSRFNLTNRWMGRIDLFSVAEDAMKAVLLEKSIGLTDE